jgi:hypothetical protein
VQVNPAGSPNHTACGKRDIHQRKVVGDGEGGGSRDEKNREIRYTYKYRL